MRHLEDTDPIPLVLARLRADQRVQALLSPGHVSGVREAPWPCLLVESGSDNLGTGRGGAVTRGVSLTLYDSFEEAHGSWACRRTLIAAAQSLAAMGDEHQDYTDRTQPIILSASAEGQIYAMRATSGQQRYITEVTFTMAPAEVSSTPTP